MNIAVCVKQVPEIALVQVSESGSVTVPPGAGQMNPFDEYAVEEGLRLREKHGGTVTVITCGDDDAVGALRAALALGADRAVHLLDPVQSEVSDFIPKMIERYKIPVIGIVDESKRINATRRRPSERPARALPRAWSG